VSLDLLGGAGGAVFYGLRLAGSFEKHEAVVKDIISMPSPSRRGNGDSKSRRDDAQFANHRSLPVLGATYSSTQRGGSSSKTTAS